MSYPARCNRRSCQARRTLAKPVEQYERRPKCHLPGCEGLMYTDWCRVRGKDRAPTCRCDAFPFPHSVRSPQCEQHTDYVLAQAFKPKRYGEKDDAAPF